MVRARWTILGIALAYFITGKLGLLLAIPPGYATAVWLPSGIALAGVLLLGYRACAGIALGSFLVNAGVSFESGSTGAIMQSVSVAGSIAAGAALQAAAGAFLVRKFVGFPSALDNERDVIKFLGLGGPLSCLINPSWSAGTLFLTGAVSASELLFNWWTGWVGDSIGVLIAAPLVLAWTAEPRSSWRLQRITITVPICIAFALAVAFFMRASRWEEERIDAEFAQRASAIGQALRDSVDHYLDVLHSLRDFYIASQFVSRDEFRAFVDGPLGRYPGFQAMSWNPRVAGGDREAWEAELRNDAGAPPAFMERDAHGRLVRAAARSEYVVVRYIEPHAQNAAALGYDVSSEPVRAEALRRARDTGKAAATGRIELVQNVRPEPGFLVFVPVYRGGTTPDSQEARRALLLGYATGVFRVAYVVASSVKNVDPAETELLLVDASAPAAGRFLYANSRSLADEASARESPRQGAARHIALDVAGRDWLLTVQPTPLYVARHRGWQAWTMLAGGFLFAGLLGAFLLVITGRTRRVEELAASMHAEAAERARAEARVRRLNRLYGVQSAINSLTARARDRGTLFREATRVAVSVGGFRFVWVGIVDRETALVKPLAWDGPEGEQGFLSAIAARLSLKEDNPDGPNLVVRAVLARKPMVANDVASDPRIFFRQEHAERGTRAVAVLPVMVSGEVAAVLVLHAQERDFFDQEEVALLSELSGDLGFALDYLEKEERLNYLAYYDALTGLANRTLFLDRLAQSMSGVKNERRKLAVAVFDVERFRMINDGLGRNAGDELLRGIAGRLREHGAERSWGARVGADQFAVLARGSNSEENLAWRLARRLEGLFSAPFRIAGQELRIAAKIGIALYPNDGTEAEAVFRNAEAALKQAKATGERHLFYHPEMNARVEEKLALENRLRQALERSEFVLHYQPKIDFEARGIVGAEALIRWNNPDLGLVAPMHFIPVLEETGLILQAGSWALRQASLDHRRWVELGLKAPRVAVNVSAIQLRQGDFVRVVEQAILDGVAPTGIDLEITESLIMEDVQGNIEKLNAVRALGVQVAIDDFGTGYSSLAYLAKLPVQSLKIDRSFVITMLEDPDTMTLVRTVIELAHSLRLAVVAEGVESEEQAKMLRLLRCDAMQGYLYCKPLPFEEMTALLEPRGTENTVRSA